MPALPAWPSAAPARPEEDAVSGVSQEVAHPLGRLRRQIDLLLRPLTRRPQLVEGEDGAQATVDENGRDDLRGEAAVRLEHPLEGRVVIGRAGVVLDDLNALEKLVDDGLRAKVDGPLVFQRAHRGSARLVCDGKGVGARNVLPERDAARAGRGEEPFQDRLDLGQDRPSLWKDIAVPAEEVTMRTRSDVEQIRTDPDPYEPYRLSQGFRVGDLLFVSGQAAIDENGNIVGADDFDAQAEQTFTNLARVLGAGGSRLENVVKVTIFLIDMANFPKVVDLRGRWFAPPYPADTIVEVRSLALPELQIEIEAIAIVE